MSWPRNFRSACGPYWPLGDLGSACDPPPMPHSRRFLLLSGDYSHTRSILGSNGPRNSDSRTSSIWPSKECVTLRDASGAPPIEKWPLEGFGTDSRVSPASRPFTQNCSFPARKPAPGGSTCPVHTEPQNRERSTPPSRTSQVRPDINSP